MKSPQGYFRLSSNTANSEDYHESIIYIHIKQTVLQYKLTVSAHLTALIAGTGWLAPGGKSGCSSLCHCIMLRRVCEPQRLGATFGIWPQIVQQGPQVPGRAMVRIVRVAWWTWEFIVHTQIQSSKPWTAIWASTKPPPPLLLFFFWPEQTIITWTCISFQNI